MGWEWRGNRWYYYHAERTGGRVVKRYVGTGRVAELAGQMDDLERRTRRDDRAALESERETLAALDAPLDRLDALADLVAEAALLAAGYRRHHRGEWRRERVQAEQPGGPAGPEAR